MIHFCRSPSAGKIKLKSVQIALLAAVVWLLASHMGGGGAGGGAHPATGITGML